VGVEFFEERVDLFFKEAVEGRWWGRWWGWGVAGAEVFEGTDVGPSGEEGGDVDEMSLGMEGGDVRGGEEAGGEFEGDIGEEDAEEEGASGEGEAGGGWEEVEVWVEGGGGGGEGEGGAGGADEDGVGSEPEG
jgi:hypothetical protein